MKMMAAAAVVAGSAALLVGPATAADPQIAGLQVALRAQGLYRGAVDGIKGPQTRGAVLAFQRRAGLAVDGVAGPRTRRALGPLGRPRLGRRLIVRGSLGWDVSALQFLLRRRGFDPGPLDGFMGGQTAGALRAFQQRMGLFADGIAGPATLAALTGSVAGPGTRPPAVPSHAKIVVRRGENLTILAARHGTTIAALARANRLDPARFLLEGAVLRVPAGATAGATAGAPAAASLSASPDEVRALIDRWAGIYGVDPALARALAWMESGFQTNLTSEADAWGVMQIIPSTWDFVEVVLAGGRIPRTAEGNVRVGVLYLRHLLRRFNGNERLALAGWYQGERAVREHGVYKESKWFAKVVLALRQRGV
jgi:peptidoglycan hydrolase-like protein with peptidoglycan-binding domain